ncbi:hypothetical protein OS493_028567 [Desmophyllum pertusum]|uniref:PLAT domain-containing protein n=1 Tax=Desmophyllum pertusum TaxID=174260 RepID=A0A9W9YWY9_9CNID|nr:hypothetical protein OS493_028567 [Desmophyllum pertusum]
MRDFAKRGAVRSPSKLQVADPPLMMEKLVVKIRLARSDSDAKQDIMKKYQPGYMDNLGFSYDLKSIMQYRKTPSLREKPDKNMDVDSTDGDGWLGLDGTHSFLYLELIGENGKRSGRVMLRKVVTIRTFNQRKTDHYVVAFKDVGPIRQLKITLKNGDKTYTFGDETSNLTALYCKCFVN